MVRIAQKVPNFEIPLISNSHFSLTGELFSATEVSKEKCEFLKLDSNEPFHQNPDSPQVPKTAKNFDLPQFSNPLLRNYQLDFFHQGVIIKFHFSARIPDSKINYFDRFVKKVIGRNFQYVIDINLSRYSNSFIYPTTGLISSIKVSIGRFTILKQDSPKTFFDPFIKILMPANSRKLDS